MVKVAGEVGEKVYIVERIHTSDASVPKGMSFVRRNLPDRGFDLDTCVPSSPVRTMEAASVRVGVEEGGVDDV